MREHTQLPDACGADEETALTGCWPTGVTAEAERIIADAGATTDHERVLALQSFFLDTDFVYDLEVDLEHNINDMNAFLTIRRGYCEQFASTFAAMTRSLGIPARVAVGFTWGDWNAARAEYVVSGRHAHAWPEVYFSGVGWVIFDPTPGRSRGHDGGITGIDEAEQFGANPEADARSLDGRPEDPDAPVPGREIAATRARPPPARARTRSRRPWYRSATGNGGNRGRWVLTALAGALLVMVGFVPGVQAHSDADADLPPSQPIRWAGARWRGTTLSTRYGCSD